MSNEQTIFFSVDTRLLNQLGEKLVTKRAVALAELVKNSYDADATHVTIQLLNITKPGGTIIVEDNGSGMSLLKFKETWMRIATIDKEQNPISRIYKREKAGEKGIGRFACRRLSKKLIIKSVAEREDGKKEEIIAKFDWPEFIAGQDVDKIPISLTSKIVDSDTPSGTNLTMDNANEAWSEEDIQRVKLELNDLIYINIFGELTEIIEKPKEYDPGFKVDFDCTDFPKTFKSLEKEFLKNAWAKLSGKINEKNQAEYELTTIKKIVNNIKNKKFTRIPPFSKLNKANFECYIFPFRADLFTKSDISLGKARKLGDQRGGIRVYADKFRVFGYGSQGDDWLRLDYDRGRSLVQLDKEVKAYGGAEDKRPGLRLFRNHNLFGYVVFDKKTNPNLESTVNRERLIENDAFEELKTFVRLGIDFATITYSNELYHEEIIQKKKEAAEKKRKKDAEKKAKEDAEKASEKAEEEKRKAIALAKQIQDEIAQSENHLRQIEKERRDAEEKRRILEEESRKSKEFKIIKKTQDALYREQQLIKEENQARISFEEKKRVSEEALRKITLTFEIELEEKQKSVERHQQVKEENLRNEEEKLQTEFSILRVLAATGTLVLMFDHELRTLVDDLEEVTDTYQEIKPFIPQEKQENLAVVFNSFNDRIEMVKELGEFLGLAVGKTSRTNKQEWVLHPIVEKVYLPFKWYFKENGVEFSNKTPDTLRTPSMYRAELVSILHNLMSNAFKAVKDEPNRREIEISGFEQKGKMFIQIRDSGKGLSENRWEEVFEIFKGDSEPDLRFGVGTGLGLKIVKDLVGSYNGEVKFIPAPKGWNTCIQIEFPVVEDL